MNVLKENILDIRLKCALNIFNNVRKSNEPIKETDKDVWGATVIRTKKTIEGKYEIERKPIEKIKARISIDMFDPLLTDNTQHIQHLAEEIMKAASKRETELFMAHIPEDADLSKYTLYKMKDWQWLADESGRIVHKDHTGQNYYADLVKYAIPMKDLEE